MKTHRLAALIILGSVLGLPLQGQVNNTLFFMHGVPQANRVNPAYQPKCGLYLGFPMLSPIRVGVNSSSLSYKDVIYPQPNGDSLITFLHPDGDKGAFLNQMKSLNFMGGDLGSSLASIGFRTGAGFFTLDLMTRVDGSLYYPGDLARLLINGAGEGETYRMDGIGADMSVFDEIAIGWSGEIFDNFHLGVRGKVLFGVGNLSTNRSDLTLTTSQTAWNLQSDMQLSASLPFAEVSYDDEGMIDGIELKEDFQDKFSPGLITDYMLSGQNLGFGLDLGIDYRPVDALQISVSVTDLAYIRWKDEVHEVSYANEYEFSGIEVDPMELSEDFTMDDLLDSTLTTMVDSLAGFLEFTTGGFYSKRLNTKLYAGASWYVTPHISFGLLSRTDFLNGRLAEQVTASANLTTGRFINFTLSYSYMNAYFKNIGAGISFNAGPFNLYVISDNGLNALFWPHEARSGNLWFGLNLVFGYKEKVDLPLVD